MLALRRNSGDWVEIRSPNGPPLRIRTMINQNNPNQIDLICDDPNRFYSIEREERILAKTGRALVNAGNRFLTNFKRERRREPT